MDKNLIAKASLTVNAAIGEVWDALINPEAIKQYMFGANVVTDWREGSPILWKGEWKGKPYEDKGEIIQFKPEHLLQYSHFSPLSGLPEKPENYHTVTIELLDEGNETSVSLTQDNNSTDEAREESEKNWGSMLEGLKKYIKKASSATA